MRPAHEQASQRQSQEARIYLTRNWGLVRATWSGWPRETLDGKKLVNERLAMGIVDGERAVNPRRTTDDEHLKTLKEIRAGHSVDPGKSIVEKIQDDLDRLVLDGWYDPGRANSLNFQYEAAGCARALGVLRSTSLSEELKLSKERVAATVVEPHN